MALSVTEQIAALATAIGLGGLLSKAVDLWVARGKARRQEPADLIRSLSELSGTLSEGGQKLVAGFIEEFTYLRKELGRLREKVEECEGKHEGCEVKVAELTARLDASEQQRAKVSREIETMLAEHPAADYAPTNLAGLVPPKPPNT